MYGLTEAFRSTYLDPAEVDRRPDSIGKAIPNAEILVVRPDGTRCEPGEEGELVHRGRARRARLLERPGAHRRALPAGTRARAGWRAPEIAVWSGDTVVADEEGFLYFVGRRDEMIKTSGYRVSPTEIEEVAYDTGLVRDAVALGRRGRPARAADRAGRHAGRRCRLDPAALLAASCEQLPLYMVPSARSRARPSSPARRTASSTGCCCARSWRA